MTKTSAHSYGVIHLNVKADIDEVDKELNAKLKAMAAKLGNRFEQTFQREFERGLSEDMSGAVRQASERAAKSARPVEVEIDADASNVERKLNQLERERHLIQARLDLEDTRARARLSELDAKIIEIRATADLNDASARAKLAKLEAERRVIEMRVDVDSASARVRLEELEDKRRNLSRTSVMRIIAELPDPRRMALLVGLFASLGAQTFGGAVAGLAAIGTAGAGAAVGVGTLALAFRGVNDALTEMQQNYDNADELRLQAVRGANQVASAQSSLASAQDSVASAASSLASAQMGVVDAQDQAAVSARQAARDVVRARLALRATAQRAAWSETASLQRIRDAERSLADAQRSAARVQDDLADARDEAARRLRSYQSLLENGRLDEREAVLSVAEAEAELARIRMDRTATQVEKRQAELRVDQARQAVRDAKRSNKELRAEERTARHEGVEGSDEVREAKERILAANQAVGRAERALAAARRQQVRDHIEGLRAVKAAEEALAAAEENQLRQRRQGAAAIAAASRSLVDAQRGVTAANRGVADAQRNLSVAQQAAVLAGQEQTKEFDKLSPAAQKFTRKLFGMRGVLVDLQEIAGSKLFPKLSEAINQVSSNPAVGFAFATLIREVGSAIGDVALEFAKLASGAEGETFTTFLATTMPGIVRQLGRIGLQLTRFTGALMTAAGPLTSKLLGDLLGWLTGLSDWAESAAGQSTMQDFFAGMTPLLEAFARLLRELVVLLLKLADNPAMQSLFVGVADGLSGIAVGLGNLSEAHPTALATGLGLLLAVLLGFKALKFTASTSKVFKEIRDLYRTVRATRGGKGKGATDVALEAGLPDGEAGRSGRRRAPRRTLASRVGLGGLFGDTLPIVEPVPGAGSGRRRRFGRPKGRLPISEPTGRGQYRAPTPAKGPKLSKGGFAKLGKGSLVGLAASLAADTVAGVVSDGKGGGRDALGGALSGAASGASLGALVGSVIPGIGTAIGAAVGGTIGGIYGAWKAVGTDGIKGLFKGMWEKLKGAGRWVKKQFSDYIVDPVKDFFGIHSPSTLFAEFGGFLIVGLKDGLLGALLGVPKWIAEKLNVHVWQPVRDFFGIGSGSPKFLELGGLLVRGLVSGFVGSGLWANLSKPVKMFMNKVINGGLIDGFNWVAAKLLPEAASEKIKIPHLELPEGFIAGGLIPGPRARRDNRLIAAASGEFVVNPAATAAHLPLLEAINAGRVPGFIGGGLVPDRDDLARLAGGVGSGLKSIGSGVKDLGSGIVGKAGDLLNPVKWLREHVGDVFDRAMAGMSGGALMGILREVPGVLLSEAAGNIRALLGSALGGGGGSGSGPIDVGGSGVTRWSPLVARVLSELGAPASALSAVLTRIRIESGGNPNAINLWDSNAQAGHPSQGLMQTIPTTFAAYAGPYRGLGITNPLASIYAGVNYAMHRYGSDWLNVMTRSGGYDSGGLLQPGDTLVRNRTGRPEAVLNPAQMAAFMDLAAAAERGRIGGDTHITVQRVEDRRVAEQIARAQQRRDLMASLAAN